MLKYVGQIAAAFAARNGTTAEELPEVIKAIHTGLQTAGGPAAPAAEVQREPRHDRKRQHR